MSKFAWIVPFAALTAVTAAVAETAIPDLRGTWKGESKSIIRGAGNPHHAAPKPASPRLNSIAFTLTVNQQDGRRFRHVLVRARRRCGHRRDIAHRGDLPGR